MRFTVFNQTYVTYITEIYDVRFMVRVFTADSDIYFTVAAENTGNTAKRFFISNYVNPFLLNAVYESGEDRWFKETWLETNEKSALPSFVLRCKEHISRTVQLNNFGVLKRMLALNGGSKLISRSETTSRTQYTGSRRGSLHQPDGIAGGAFKNPKKVTTFSDVAVFGDILNVHMPPGSSIRLDMQFVYRIHCNGFDGLNDLRRQPFSAGMLEQKLNARLKAGFKSQENMKIQFKGSAEKSISEGKLNPFMVHLRKQIEFCALLRGYAQTGAGSLIGVRDVMQALEAFLIWEPEQSREKIREVLGFMDSSGRCPRQYSLPAYENAVPHMDLRPFIDQGVWVIATIVNYLKFTNDFSLLDEVCGYYDIVDEDARLVRKSNKSDSVLQHMLRVIEYLLSNIDEETGCPKILFGDWNDALDGLGVSSDPDKKYGNGVSVMAAAQVWQNLNDMQELLSRIDAEKYAHTMSCYRAAAHRISQGLRKYGVVQRGDTIRITHGWGEDRRYYVGSFGDSDGKSRLSLTSNAYWVLSGLLSQDLSMREQIHADIMNLDSKYGLLTFKPPFAEDAPGVGRIPKLPEGTAENGAAYVHASVFGVMALFESGYPEDAWRMLEKALPFTHDFVSLSPFVMPNSYGYNPDKGIDGESMNDWQTGSSNVVLKLLIRYVIGIKPEYDGIRIQPAAYCPFDGFTASIKAKGSLLSVEYVNTRSGKRKIWLDGRPLECAEEECMRTQVAWIPNERLNRSSKIEIYD